MRSLTRITDAINETLDQEKKPFNSTYDSALKKATDMLILYGYSDDSFMYYKEDFLDWFMKKGINSPLYKAEKITKEIIDTMMMDYFLFKVDNDREPNDYKEFRTYILRDDKN